MSSFSNTSSSSTSCDTSKHNLDTEDMSNDHMRIDNALSEKADDIDVCGEPHFSEVASGEKQLDTSTDLAPRRKNPFSIDSLLEKKSDTVHTNHMFQDKIDTVPHLSEATDNQVINTSS